MAHLERVNGTVTCKIGAPIGFDLVQLMAYLIIGLISANIGVALGRLIVG